MQIATGFCRRLEAAEVSKDSAKSIELDGCSSREMEALKTSERRTTIRFERSFLDGRTFWKERVDLGEDLNYMILVVRTRVTRHWKDTYGCVDEGVWEVASERKLCA